MRRFIVVDTIPSYTEESDKINTRMYDKESLVDLLDKLGILYPDEKTEQEVIDDVNDCNGDGDHYFYIYEIKNDRLEILIGDEG